LIKNLEKEIKIMPRGELKRYEILSRVYKLKEELKYRDDCRDKRLADEYLNKVLEYIEQFHY